MHLKHASDHLSVLFSICMTVPLNYLVSWETGKNCLGNQGDKNLVSVKHPAGII